ncbi:alpha/beta fold hydrolase [Nonomuraea phyllanthi]|uniref:Alpha/beta fold hydrolase n=1 Tax=Nonomuraea phyllanthi TaxID=2219224 RepID=A0A5C4VT29_9ACTN|nr:alpha/beta fold hydrolase [Nonomuraea phyllanthi]KAB8189958.1 alpha/beta fold hydrolase [Nonomuraea phyllanthi]
MGKAQRVTILATAALAAAAAVSPAAGGASLKAAGAGAHAESGRAHAESGRAPVASGRAPGASGGRAVRTAARGSTARAFGGGGAAALSLPPWLDCGDGLQCAKLPVPVDWSAPDGPRTEIDLARMPARDPGRTLGALMVNLGDGSTIQAVRARPDTVSELTRWFDVVLVEARGFGDRGSAAMLACPVAQPDPRRLLLAPGERAWRRYARDNAAYDDSCRAAAGPAYDGLASWQVAHDLDAVRAALGEPRLRYLGSSYGAVYGKAYLELFPDTAGRMYLEGGPDHTEAGLERRVTAQARAAERRLFAFRDWCRARRGCPLGHDDAVAVLADLRRRTPLNAGPGHLVKTRRLLAAVYAGLVPERWPQLAQAMSAAREGDAAALAAMADVAAPAPPGTVTGILYCHDFVPDVPSDPLVHAMEARLRKVAPRIGWLAARQELARCLGLPRGVAPSWPPHAPGPRNGPRALVGIGRLDVAAHPAPRIPGTRVLWHGDGSGAYLLQGVSRLRATCLRTRVHNYLVNGVLPERGASCPAELTATL